jgi:hypothetical protein
MSVRRPGAGASRWTTVTRAGVRRRSLPGGPVAAFAVAALIVGANGVAGTGGGAPGASRASGLAIGVATARLASLSYPDQASAPGCSWAVVPTPSPPANSFLRGVATRSPGDAWAVGSSTSAGGDISALIERWNGTAWGVTSSPHVGQTNQLNGVAIVSARNAGAVGSYEGGTSGQDTALIEHWNGAAWKPAPSPHPGAISWLNAVATISWRNAWAVGGYADTAGGHDKTFIEHWNGREWKRALTPTVMIPLSAVAAISWRNAWAVGYVRGEQPRDVILHWNGRGWKRVAYSHPAGGSLLTGVAAASWRDVWAVGSTTLRTSAGQALVEHWNGRNWKRVPTPDAGLDGLDSVAAVSSRNAWATGGSDGQGHSFFEHWNGTNWRGTSTPGLGGTGGVGSVAASSASDVWAVGSYDNATNDFTFALHCG